IVGARGLAVLQLLLEELRVRTGVTRDVPGGAAVPAHLLPGGQLDSPGGHTGRGADGPSQSVSLGAAGDLCVSVSGGLSIFSAGKERWSSPAGKSDGEKS